MSQFDDIEICCSKLIIGNAAIFVVCIYIPPNLSTSLPSVSRYLEAVRFIDNNMRPSDKIIIFGDFNQPGIDWWSGDPDCTFLYSNNAFTAAEMEIVDVMQSLGFLQINPVKNINNRTLDLIFTNFYDDCIVERSNGALVPEDNHHPSINIFFVNYFDNDVNYYNFFRFDFKHADYNAICNDLTDHDWSDFFEVKNIEVLCNKFYQIMNDVIFNNVPVIRSRDDNTGGCPWINREISNIKRLKNNAYRIWRSTRTTSDYRSYRGLKSQLKIAVSRAYFEYINEIQGDLKTNPKGFWKYINSINNSDGYPNILHFGNSSSDSPPVICNMFASFFQSVYVECDQNIDLGLFNYIPNSDSAVFPDFHISEDAVLEHLLAQDPNFIAGPDGVPSGLLRNCALPLYKIICHMFNTSLSAGCFPAGWKTSYIVPIFKSGRKQRIENYRGICKQSAIPKVFDALISERLSFYCKMFISDNQHGFMKGRSTVTNLLYFTNFLTNHFMMGMQVDAIYTDFSKAFDRVNNTILLYKLSRLGFPTLLLRWLSSYLRNRTQKVVFRNHLSSEVNVTSGVPQGSHIGPLLFILYINDVVSYLPPCNMLIFADDIKLFLPVRNRSDIDQINIILEHLWNWCSINRLPLNVDKCAVITYTHMLRPLLASYLLGTKTLNRVSTIKDLGVILDSKLSYIDHINYITGKANRTWGRIRRYSTIFSDPYVIKTLFTAFVRPLLEYASIIWFPFYTVHINRIETIQKRFLRFALRALPWTDVHNLPSYVERLNLIGLKTLQHRNSVAKVIFIFQLLIGEIYAPVLLDSLNICVNSINLRHNRFIVSTFSGTNYGRLSSLNGIIHEFNRSYNYVDFNISTNELKFRLLNS